METTTLRTMATAKNVTGAIYLLREVVGESTPSQIPTFKVAKLKAAKTSDGIKYYTLSALPPICAA